MDEQNEVVTESTPEEAPVEEVTESSPAPVEEAPAEETAPVEESAPEEVKTDLGENQFGHA